MYRLCQQYHDEHKSNEKPKRPKTRDKIAKQLGLSPTSFVRYMSIARLEDNLLATVGMMLDEQSLSFMSAYYISKLKPDEIPLVIKIVDKNAHVTPETMIKFKTKNFKLLLDESNIIENILTDDEIMEILTINDENKSS